ncbi:MAG: TonB-dependent receptor [Bacteroidia bacterium]|nr:TonB-dependent receptor [Bacteroidia bacterium]
MKKCLLGWICALCALSLHAQYTKIQVLDAHTQEPVPHAQIRILTGQGVQPGIAYTNNKGEGELLPGRYLVYSSFYQASTTDISAVLKGVQRVYLYAYNNGLSPVTVWSGRSVNNRDSLAQQIEVIPAREIAAASQPTSAELLSQSGKVFVQKSQLGGGSPVMRGFEASRVLFVIDGVRQNNAIYRAGHLQNVLRIDNSILERVELIYGPASTAYGSDALGGVMHFYTKNPTLSVDKKFSTSGNAYLRYSTAYNEKTGHFDIDLSGKTFGSLTSVTFSHFGDLRQGNITPKNSPRYWDRTFTVKRINGQDSAVANPNTNRQTGSGYYQYDLMQKFLFLSNKANHVVNLQFSNSSNVNRYDRLTETDASGTPRFGEWYYGPEQRLLASYKVVLNHHKKAYDYATITAAYQNIRESRHSRNFQAPNRTSRYEQLHIGTVNGDFVKRHGNHHISYGFEVAYNRVLSTAERINVNTGAVSAASTRYPDGGSHYYSAALYAMHTWNISRKLVLNDGIRINYAGIRSLFRDTVFFPFLQGTTTQNNIAPTAMVGLNYMPESSWKLRALASTGFRAPNVDDLGRVFDSNLGEIVIIPNKNIQPEYTINMDLGISKRVNAHFLIELNGFFTYMLNAVQLRPYSVNGQDSLEYDGTVSRIWANQNTGKAFITGLNLNMEARFNGNFSMQQTFTYTYGRVIDSVLVPMDHIAPFFGRTSLIYEGKKWRAEAYALYQGAKALRDYSASGEDNLQYATPEGMPGWYTLNLRASYSPVPQFQVQMACENLLDRRYRTFASGISSPGRNFSVTLRARW